MFSEKGSPLKDVLLSGLRTDDEPISLYQATKDKIYSSAFSQNYDTKLSPSVSEKNSKQQFNSKNIQPNMLSDLASVVRSTSKDGQIMPGHRLRQKASSMLKLKCIE